MRIIVLGCGRVGARLASVLSTKGHNVCIIDKNSGSFKRLDPEFKGRVLTGLGIDGEVLKNAGIENAEVFIAATNGDNTNIMASQMAREIFKVPKVITRIYDPERSQAFAETGLDTICSTTVMADMIIQKIGRGA